jgi:hypothetical protein
LSFTAAGQPQPCEEAFSGTGNSLAGTDALVQTLSRFTPTRVISTAKLAALLETWSVSSSPGA